MLQGVAARPAIIAACRCISTCLFVYLDELEDMTIGGVRHCRHTASRTTSRMGRAPASRGACFAGFPGVMQGKEKIQGTNWSFGYQNYAGSCITGTGRETV